ncbi:hypothetical protein [Bordetella genomosp. 4]|uniref:Uncharacterized protein n=1 Tax=Bordetella genomosp. 4 TaxID=463044 RepID=A0A261U4H5_9BORD|nr:hypothetical protein [Bordetella genomosp. 4]OZI48448.1 hypothetical protein CAL21_11350 [Bordetella genomosp. 4]OZI56471.1 hypothetical protein CAL20_13665 [Bordetella genomosp. 4]
MPRINVQQGELAQWLQFISDGEAAGVSREQIPSHVAEGLLILLCIKETDQGKLVLTDKGRLALRMESPGAIHLG